MRTVSMGVRGLAMLATFSAGVALAKDGPQDFMSLSVEELMSVKITSVSKKPERLSSAAAAVHVITSEEIRRSGYTSIPEALRLVPGMEVSRTGSSSWTIGARGLSSGLSNKLLVLIDGRSVYTPLYGGVFWDVQDVLLEDVERIEVIRGPGGALWGANAVNGVINVVTKSALATEGEYLTAGTGGYDRGFGAVRYGRKLGRAVSVRLFGKYFDRDALPTDPAVTSPGDDWQIGHFGFRADATRGANEIMLQGAYYDGEAGQRGTIFSLDAPYATSVFRSADRAGFHALGRWTRALGGGSEASLVLYFDRTERDFVLARETRETFDADFQHRFSPAGGHDVVWGGGYRLSVEDLIQSQGFDLTDPDRKPHLVSGFVQDEVDLVPDRLVLTLGTKVEHNDFTGFEYQPSGRVAWTPSARRTLWGSVSRAVRTPTRLEADSDWVLGTTPPGALHPTLPGEYLFVGTDDFASEEVLSYEAGYRSTILDAVTLDVAAFYNEYSGLLTGEFGAPYIDAEPDSHFVVPLFSGNFLDARAWGGEVLAQAKPAPWLRLQGQYGLYRIEATLDPSSTAGSGPESIENASARHRALLRVSADAGRGVEADAILRFVDEVRSSELDAYAELDLRVGWRLPQGIEIALVGKNLFHDERFESGASTARAVERTFYVQITSRR